MAGLRRRYLAHNTRRLSTATRADYPILWLSDSIYNMDELEAATESGLAASYVADSVRGTYGGTTIGMGLLELADETQAYQNGAWATCTRGLPFSYFRAVLFEYGRNDAFSAESSTAYRKAYDKLVSQAITYLPRAFVSGNCPPRALADLTDWDLSQDAFINLGHLDACATVATKWGHRHYDLNADFLALEDAGTYTVAQLMRDTYHPTVTTGATRIAAKLVEKLLTANTPNAVSAEISGRVVNYLFGEPTVGSWAFVATPNTVGPTTGPLFRIASMTDVGLQISSSGKKVSFPSAQFEQLWVHYYRKSPTGGNATLYIDRGLPGEVTYSLATTSVYNDYPISYLAAAGLGATTHTVEIETTDANAVCLLGVTYVGVP